MNNKNIVYVDLPMLHNEEGWMGAFTRESAPGALRPGTRVVKRNSEPGDTNADGVPGVVLGSISHPKVGDGAVMYFIEWAAYPRCAAAVMHFKVREAQL